MSYLSVLHVFLVLMHCSWCIASTQSLQQSLWLECSCQHAVERNGSNWGAVHLNATLALTAKNDCYMIFITGSSDDIVAFRFKQLQLTAGCSDYVEIFPYLREAVIENSTNPEYVICNRANTTATSGSAAKMTPASVAAALATSATNATAASDASAAAATVNDLRTDEFIYSAGKVLGIRVRFKKPRERREINNWILNITGEYRFLRKDYFRNDGRLIAGSYCDYYFFADAISAPKSMEIWQYFHSPRFPAKYPAHIKCAYKFIGRPDSRVEIIFEELHVPKQEQSCSMDKLTIFDSESANMNAVIDVLCNSLPTRRIISSGPDLLIEFNASSNITDKGFRGKFKFLHNEIEVNYLTTSKTTTTTARATTKSIPAEAAEAVISMEKIAVEKQFITYNLADTGKVYKSLENCKQIFDSRVNKSGRFDSLQLFIGSNIGATHMNKIGVEYFLGRVQCRYEFYGNADERIQIKFLDFNIPTESKNGSDCKSTDAFQILTQVRGKYEATDLFCGSFLPKPIMSSGPKIILQFVGKYPTFEPKISFYGFKAEYKFLTNYGIITGQQLGNNCTFIFNSTVKKSGWLGSPNFPGYYPQNMNCDYLFYGEPEEKIIIRFTYFDVEGIGTCEYLTASDYVEFSNYMSTDRKYTKYCGKREKFEVRSDGRFFRVTFFSNDRFEKSGFRALYDFEIKHTPVENTSTQSFVSTNKCVGMVSTNSHLLIIYIIYTFYCIKQTTLIKV